jgi:phosphoesterase RecJ-like protein
MTNSNVLFKNNHKSVLDAWNLIKNARHITLLAHFKPDGDAMSSCAAFELFIKNFDATKKITTIYPSVPEDFVKHTPSTVLINTHKEDPDLVIAFDTANYDRLYFPKSFESIPFIIVDHHISNALTGTYQFVEPSISSTCELLYLLMKEWAPEYITQQIAEALMFGILCDTLTFSIQTINSQTLRVAAELIDKGVSLYEVRQSAFRLKSPETVHLWGTLMQKIIFSPSKKAAWIIISQDELKKANATTKELIGFNNFIAGLSDCDVLIIGYETEDKTVKLSFRSKHTDVNALAKQFGGGGHMYASGALCKENLDSVQEKIKKICEML